MDWLTIFAMVLIIEGLMPLLFPQAWQNYVKKLASEPLSSIRRVGAVLFAIGIILLWLQ